MPKFLQPSLSGGELAPGLRGRVDMARYQISVQKARNFITKPTGGGSKRPGRYFRGRAKYSDRPTRFVPFVYSTIVKYLIEMGDGYFRFWVNGALLTNSTKTITNITQANPAVVTAAAHGFANGQQVAIGGVAGMTRLNSRTFAIANVTTDTFELVGADTSTYAAYLAGGTASRVVEVVTPYTGSLIHAVRYTQSADVLTLTHGQIPQQELRRLTAVNFELRPFPFKRGPFRPFNTDEALVMAASDVTGNVTVTTNVDTFTATMVDSLIYVEEKELRGVKPWASAEKNVPVGALRRSDSKVYRCVSIPSSIGSKGVPYWVAGGVRPVHDDGRAFDGPQDVKDDGVNSYGVGVEWEFLHNTFGIMKVTGYLTARSVEAVVIERLPDSIKGLAPSPAGSWTFSGDGTTVAFAITGATSTSRLDYQVTVNGEPVQPNPFYTGGGGVNGGGGGNPRPGGGTEAAQQLA